MPLLFQPTLLRMLVAKKIWLCVWKFQDTIHQLEKKYGMPENEGGYESTIAYSNGVSNLYGFCAQPNNITHGSGYEPQGPRLA